MNLTIYHADCVGVQSNCLYPNGVVVTEKRALKNAVSHDYVCAAYKDNHRSNENFLASDCLPVDCDNDHTEDPEDWITPAKVAEAFPGVAFAVHYSRNHMKEKNGKAGRPKFHVLFSIARTRDKEKYIQLKQRTCDFFPYFDTNALDAARFFYGTEDPEVEIFDGSLTLDKFLENVKDFDADMDGGFFGDSPIHQGSRNNTMARYAARLVKRYGGTEAAHKKFLALAGRCEPPLDEHELNAIWTGAVRFGKKVAAKEGYIPPEEYNLNQSLKPDDYSDIGQAMVLTTEYSEKLCYSASTDFLVYNGSFWEESKLKAQKLAQELTTRQLEEAKEEVEKTSKILEEKGVWNLFAQASSKKKALLAMSAEQQRLYSNYESAMTYQAFVVRHRDSKYITAMLREAQPLLEIDGHALDANEYFLNTPSATYDLRTGKRKDHSPEDSITKQTRVDPDNKGLDIWLNAVDTFFPDDEQLQDYVQDTVGLAAIGKVFQEALVIAYGDGRNGKSTFWNTVARVLGTYSGNLSADTLTVNKYRNVKPELAEARGKRLLIAAELEEGVQLSTSLVKQLCSTDEVYAEKKYKDPFAYIPTHMVVLYTNHLPKVEALDEGTWRRLVVIPFNARIEGKSDIKNYADYLYQNCGGAVLSWIMEGAKRVIANGHHLKMPPAVEAASRGYREINDWLAPFLDECCEVDPSYEEKSGQVYKAYHDYCKRIGERVHSTTDFAAALSRAGFEKYRTGRANMIRGLRVITTAEEEFPPFQ